VTVLNLIESQLQKIFVDWINSGSPNVDEIPRTSESLLDCPAASGTHGHSVFAVFDEDLDRLRFLPEAIAVPSIVKDNLEMSDFSSKNRLVGKCLTSSCHHWQGACRLGFFTSSLDVQVEIRTRNCVIEKTCRWRKENGPVVCAPCSSLRNLPVH
jgi:hypothetical protein